MLFRCYTPHLTHEVGRILPLTPEASHHIAKVLRHGPGDEVLLFGQDAGDYRARIIALKPLVSVELIEHLPNISESSLKLHLIQGLARNEKMDWILQKATELGVSQITPLQTEKVQIKLSMDKWPKKKEHWEQILISASEQSGRCKLPVLSPLVSFKQWMAHAPSGPAIVFHPRATQTLNEFEFEGQDLKVYIGPESGFSDEEFEGLSTIATPLCLGPRILRTETAAITALSICQGRWGDLYGR